MFSLALKHIFFSRQIAYDIFIYRQINVFIREDKRLTQVLYENNGFILFLSKIVIRKTPAEKLSNKSKHGLK